MELTHGVKMLSIVFSIFTFCYITRFLYDILVEPDLAFANAYSGFTLPIMWDFLPILLMFMYHIQNLRILKEPIVIQNIRNHSTINMDSDGEE